MTNAQSIINEIDRILELPLDQCKQEVSQLIAKLVILENINEAFQAQVNQQKDINLSLSQESESLENTISSMGDEIEELNHINLVLKSSLDIHNRTINGLANEKDHLLVQLQLEGENYTIVRQYKVDYQRLLNQIEEEVYKHTTAIDPNYQEIFNSLQLISKLSSVPHYPALKTEKK